LTRTWHQVSVTIRWQTPDLCDERTITLPCSPPLPTHDELLTALEYLGWGAYNIVSIDSAEVQS
jgi:hypothetical protein